MTASIALATLLSLFHTNAVAARCIERHRAEIIAAADRAEVEYGVPAAVLLTVAYLETHVGCTDGAGRANWGAPISSSRRHVHGTPLTSASALRWSFTTCGSWSDALSRYRCGLCRCNPERLIGYTPGYAVYVIRRVYSRAGVELPDGFAPRVTRRARR